MSPLLGSGHTATAGLVIASFRRRALILSQLCFLLGTGLALTWFNDTVEVVAAGGVSLAISMVSIALARRGAQRAASACLAVQFVFLPVSLAYVALGTYDAAMVVIPAGMMIMAVVAQPRVVAAFVAATLAGAGFILAATLNDWLPHPLPAALRASAAIDGPTTLIILAFCGLAAIFSAQILDALLAALSRHQAELETTVTRRTQALQHSNLELRETLATLDRTRDELARGQRLAALGRLVAGVAHQLNTPIGNAAITASALRDRAETFASRVAEAPLTRTELDAFIAYCREGAALLTRATTRAGDLINSFKQVAVEHELEPRRPFAFDALLADTLARLKPKLPPGDWRFEHATSDLHGEGYPGALAQVLEILLENAVVHGFDNRDRGRVRIAASPAGAQTIRLTIADDGSGIPPAVLPHIFDPFFTTRLGQGGSGLGLAICHNLVGGILGGRIEVASTTAGTCFNLFLPLKAPERAIP